MSGERNDKVFFKGKNEEYKVGGLWVGVSWASLMGSFST